MFVLPTPAINDKKAIVRRDINTLCLDGKQFPDPGKPPYCLQAGSIPFINPSPSRLGRDWDLFNNHIILQT